MESKTNYTIVGVVVLILLVGLVTTMLWLSVGFNQKKYTTYTVYMHEAAAGLTQDAPVKYNGVQVGYVKEIRLNQNDPRQVEILLDIEEGTPVTTSTYATLNSQGITGVTYIGLSASTSNLTPLEKMPDEPYPVIPSKPSVFNQLDSILKRVSEDVGIVTTEAQRIFNEENAKHIKHILANFDNFSKNLAKTSKDFPHMLDELRVGIAQFNTMAESLSKAGNSVSKTMGSGRSTLDKISQEALPPAVVLLRRLNAISANLEKVSSEMRQNPAVVIRGSKPPKPGPGE
ncbi:MlaD family protein [Fluoribacter dumoffii]|uniref:Virulence factor Mce family protein n=1 Tax=Fluoribacter dumoffii TaxID=463 RepID=A0A377GBM4_9GAMM|nr:MlaD family protein [Fluoribacter dumoffii]KTC88592.1 Mammalian cell entry related domain protein [Fluoribacter dumoffii NY 23]MCW8386115.1 MlaD family protein [Fluoribacter dumoffii]MCW8419167.1 MlaD family protein [Fluoribacter dumoffii]MCW8452989.1 MlaD family protein [Fluoribacter dumoffii]MCW8459793.1 MlaD family protein [Fluoribacter dumoffii]